MQHKLNGEFHTLFKLEQVFENSCYTIPDYQRGYSWEKAQRTDLLEDIQRIAKSSDDSLHYMGTLVAARNQDQVPGQYNYQIVDGQQRLTSLILLIRVLLNHLEEGEYKQSVEKLVFTRHNDASVLWAKWDKNTVLQSFINSYDDASARVKGMLIHHKAEQNVRDAWVEYHGWIQTNDFDLSQITKAVLSRLGFIFFTPKRSKTLGIMFEVINNRGKLLSELDKIKNYLIYYSEYSKDSSNELKKRINQAWGTILENLSNARLTKTIEENSFVSDVWYLFSEINIRERGHVYTDIKTKYPVEDHTPTKNEELISFVDFIKDASFAMKDLYTAESKGDNNNIKQKDTYLLEHLRFHKNHDALHPLYVAIWVAKHHKKISSTEYSDLLELIEKMNFRIHELPNPNKRSDSYVGTLIPKARGLFRQYYPYQTQKENCGNDSDYLIASFAQEIEEFVKKECPINETFVAALTLDIGESFDYYGWNSLKYFLASYEQQHRYNIDPQESFPLSTILDSVDVETETNSPKRSQREHMFARKNRWLEPWGDEGKHQNRRLGNFILLKEGENKRLSHLDLEAKLIKLNVIKSNEWMYCDGERYIQFYPRFRVQYRMSIYDNKKNWKALRHALEDKSLTMKHWESYEELNTLFKKAFDHYEPNRRYDTRRRNVYVRFFDLREEKLINWAIQRWALKSELEEAEYKVTINSFVEELDYFQPRAGLGDKIYKIKGEK